MLTSLDSEAGDRTNSNKTTSKEVNSLDYTTTSTVNVNNCDYYMYDVFSTGVVIVRTTLTPAHGHCLPYYRPIDSI